MKHFFLLLVLAGCLAGPSWSQTPANYFDSTSFWALDQYYETAGASQTTRTYWTINDDSIALGQIWYKLYRTRFSSVYYPPNSSTGQYAHQYAGLLRQEGRKMRMVFPNTASDSIIYDFDLQTGEEFFPDLLVVYDTLTTLVGPITPFAGDTTRLVFDNQQGQGPPYGNRWIEGIGATIGSIFGPEPVDCFSVICQQIGFLTCYRMQGNDHGFGGCNSAWQGYQAIVQAVSSTQPDPVEKALWLSPNPGRDQLDLHTSGMAVQEIRLVSPSGQVVSRYSAAEAQAGAIISLPVGSLPPGIYTVWVYGAGSAKALRWVKI